MVDPDWSGGDKDVNQKGDTIETMQKHIKEGLPSRCHQVILDNIGVEGRPVDDADHQGAGGGQALQGPGELVWCWQGTIDNMVRLHAGVDDNDGVDDIVQGEETDALVGH